LQNRPNGIAGAGALRYTLTPGDEVEI